MDLKGDGGFVIWWPQRGCRVLCEGPVADFPSWLWARGEMGSTIEGAGNGAGIVEPIPSEVARATAYEINYARRALANACFELRNCPQGSRNSKLNVLAWNMGRLMCGVGLGGSGLRIICWPAVRLTVYLRMMVWCSAKRRWRRGLGLGRCGRTMTLGPSEARTGHECQ